MSALRSLPPASENSASRLPLGLAQDLRHKTSPAGYARIRRRIDAALGPSWEPLLCGPKMHIARRLAAAADGALRDRPADDPAMDAHRCVEVQDVAMVKGGVVFTPGLMAASLHALARLVQRGGARDADGVLAAVREAHDAVLRLEADAYLYLMAAKDEQPPDVPASLVIPVGRGVFLADLLMIDTGQPRLRPFFALRSWVHDDQMFDEQAKAAAAWRELMLPSSSSDGCPLPEAIIVGSRATSGHREGASARQSRFRGVVPRRTTAP